jgi:hypothetical protein
MLAAQAHGRRAAIVGLLVLTTLVSCRDLKLLFSKPEWGGREEAVGTITMIHRLPDVLFDYRFEYNGRVYKGEWFLQTPFEYSQLPLEGKYMVQFDPTNPGRNSMIKLTSPVFMEDEKTGRVITKVLRSDVTRWPRSGRMDWIRLDHRFQVNGLEYNWIYAEVAMYNAPKQRDLNGKRFWATYWKKNPQRCIIHLDQPVDERKPPAPDPLPSDMHRPIWYRLPR